MALTNSSKVKHLASAKALPSTLTAGTLYFNEQTDGQYVVYLGQGDGTKKKITTIVNSAPTNSSGNIAANDTLVAALGKLQGRIATLETNSASMFQIKGTIGTGGDIPQLPTSAEKGDAYRVITAGTYGDHEVEVNDWLICSTGSTTSPTWVVLQGNIELDDVDLVFTSNNNGGKLSLSGAGISTEVDIPFASKNESGLMSSSQAEKLAGLNNYSLPSATGTQKGGVILSDATNSSSDANSSVAATPKAVKAAYDLASGKWTYNAETIKAVKVNAAGTADVATKLQGVNEDTGETFEYDATDIDSAYQQAANAVQSANAAQLAVSQLDTAITSGTKAAGKTKGTLTVGTKSFNGSTDTSITKSDLGLGNVDNTADANKTVNAAAKLTTSNGDSNTPVYFSNGKPVACTGLDLNTTGTSQGVSSSEDVNAVYAYEDIENIENLAEACDTALTWGTW